MGIGSQLHTSAQMVHPALGSRSKLTTSQPSSAKALPTDPVPENNSSNRGILVFHVGLEGEPDDCNEGGAAAGQLQVAQRALPEALPLRDILIEEPRVAAPGGTRHVGRTSLFWKHQEKRGPDRATMELILGEVQTNARGGKFLPLKGNLVWRSTQPAAVMWEPSAYKDAAGDRVNVCLEATEEALAAVAGWEAAAAKMAAKQAPAMFGKPLTEAQLLERFQSCLKTSAQGVKFVKLKATLANVRFWDSEGKRTEEAPDCLRGRRILAAVQPRQLWVMNQQRGLLLELRDVKLDEGVEECPL